MNLVLSTQLIDECKSKLIKMRADLLNQSRSSRAEFVQNNKNYGDEIDQSVAFLAEHQFLITQDRIRAQLLEITYALARIEQGTFGICEETGEAIETERLLALPYTRVSIEGAEIREAVQRRYGGR